jgi:hypothetical protein
MKNAKLLFAILLMPVAANAQLYNNQSELLLGRQGHSVAVLDQWMPSFEESNFLISGGFDGSLVTTACEWNGEFYDMNFPRIDHTSNAFGVTKVLIAGGYDGVGTNYESTEIFDTVTEEFTAGPIMLSPRSYHRSIQMNDGNILITGGFDGINYLSSCEIFNTNTEQFVAIQSMNYARSSHSICVLPNGNVVVTGGYNPAYNFQMVECEMYNPFTEQWTILPDLAYGRDNHASAAVGERVYVSGGREYNSSLNLFQGRTQVEYLDIDGTQWIFAGDTQHPHSYHEMVLQRIDQTSAVLLIPGGVDHTGIDVDFTYSNSEYSTFSLNATSNTWQDINWGTGGGGNTVDGRYDYAVGSYFVSTGINGFNREIAVFGGLSSFGDVLEIGIYYGEILSIENIENTGLSIYPQPCANECRIQMKVADQYSFSLIDAQGKEVMKTNFAGQVFTIENLNQGIFFYTINSDQNSYSGKLIAQ